MIINLEMKGDMLDYCEAHNMFWRVWSASLIWHFCSLPKGVLSSSWKKSLKIKFNPRPTVF